MVEMVLGFLFSLCFRSLLLIYYFNFKLRTSRIRFSWFRMIINRYLYHLLFIILKLRHECHGIHL